MSGDECGGYVFINVFLTPFIIAGYGAAFMVFYFFTQMEGGSKFVGIFFMFFSSIWCFGIQKIYRQIALVVTGHTETVLTVE